MGIKILVVDTDADVQHLLQVRLGRAGFEVQTAFSAESAQEMMASTGRPDLVISEVLLPGMNGLELARSVKSRPQPPIFLLLSGLSADAQIAAGFEAGIDDYITKPFSPLVIIERVRVNLLRSGRLQPEVDSAQLESEAAQEV